MCSDNDLRVCGEVSGHEELAGPGRAGRGTPGWLYLTHLVPLLTTGEVEQTCELELGRYSRYTLDHTAWNTGRPTRGNLPSPRAVMALQMVRSRAPAAGAALRQQAEHERPAAVALCHQVGMIALREAKEGSVLPAPSRDLC